jgi:hypothetical protein
MNRSSLVRRAGLAAGAAAVVAGAGIGVAGATTGNVSATAHTMRFVGSQLKDTISHNVDVATDQNAWKGKTTGYDVTSCVIDIQTHVAACKVAVARAQGILLARAKVNVDTGKGSGTVTGGTGGFRGATGTIAISPGPSPDSNKITISYQV